MIVVSELSTYVKPSLSCSYFVLESLRLFNLVTPFCVTVLFTYQPLNMFCLGMVGFLYVWILLTLSVICCMKQTGRSAFKKGGLEKS